MREALNNEPFAEATHRTKWEAAGVVTVSPGQSGNIDFQLSEERFVYGGEGLVLGAQPGDYITACVVDAFGVIPEAYRAALCEAWPIVNTYILKRWLMVQNAGQNTTFEVNTFPLTAKISQGLVLRTTYHATNAGDTRTIYTNLFLTKKL